MQVKKQWLAPGMEHGLVQNWEECINAVYSHPAYLTYMQSTSCKMPDWMKRRLESRLLGEISITSGTQITLMAKNEEELKSC